MAIASCRAGPVYGGPRGQAQLHAGGIGHVQPVGIALEDGEFLDGLLAMHDRVDLGLCRAARHAHLRLGSPGVLVNQ